MDKYKNLFILDNKIAVVTGAVGILGKEFCKALCSFGAIVICLDLDANLLELLTEELSNQYGTGKAVPYVCDVSQPESVAAVVNNIIHQYDKIDILLNNAATKTSDLQAFFTPFTDYSLETWRQVMAVNLDGMFLMAQAVGKQMANAQRGSIINTASIYSLHAPDQRIYQGSSYMGGEINTPAVYTASKAGVIGLTKHLATLWGAQNVRVNALCPGGVASGQNDVFNKKYAERIPMGRMAETLDIIGPMLFLASDAAKYITGQAVFADGGLSAW